MEAIDSDAETGGGGRQLLPLPFQALVLTLGIFILGSL